MADDLSSVYFFPFIAPPSGGKGTQTQALVERFGFPKVDMGAMLREIAKEDSPLAETVRQRIENGLLVETPVVLDVLKHGIQKELAKSGQSKAQGFILDGFPRNQEQTEGLLSLCDETGAHIGQVVYLDVPYEVITERAVNRRLCSNCGAIYNLKTKAPKQADVCDECGHSPLTHRADDQGEKVTVRLNGFDQETRPILSIFEDRRVLTRVDGNRAPQVITEELITLVGAHMPDSAKVPS